MKHLSEEQIAQWIAGERAAAVESHLAGCEQCRAAVAGFEDVLAQFRASARSVVVPAPSQRVRRSMVWPRLVAAAAALTLFVAVPLYRERQERERAVLAQQDAQLLQEVDAEISQKVPDAMDPLMNLVSWNSGSTGHNLMEEQK
jgi:anti-sigma factor RsiW